VPGADAGVPTNDQRQHFDTGVINLVGQAGLGDISLTPDESRLLVVNLSTRALHQFAATAPYAPLRADALPASVAACPGGAGDFRPFGVRARRTVDSPLEIFVAFVCSGATRATFADVRAGALRSADSGASWALAALEPIDANHNDPAAASRQEERWTYWRNGEANCTGSNAYAAMCPQPLATSINFLFDGRLLIGLRDRFGDMVMPVQRVEGGTTYPLGRGTGDALILAPSGPSTWGGAVLAASGNEYLQEETYGANLHPEPLWGALAVLPGTSSGGVGQQIVANYKAPYSVLSGGAGWFDYTGAASGAPLTGLEEIYDDQMAATFGKTSGLGDLEPLCVWAQIGDRVWIDQNGNGAQDTGEPGQPGVRLRVTQGARSIDVTTNAAGNWTVYVNPFAAFRIQVISGVPSGYAYTGANRDNDARDSDADASGLIDQATPINATGFYDSSYDIGLVQQANVRIAKSGPASAQSGTTIAYTLSYTNDGPGAAGDVTVRDTLPPGLAFVSSSLAPTAQSGQTLTWNIGRLGAGANGSIIVYASVSSGASGNVSNTATISTTTPGDNPADNTATATTNIPATIVDLTILKAGDMTGVRGRSVTYRLTYGHRYGSQASASGVVVQDVLPAGLTFASASPAPSSVSGQTLTWNIGGLALDTVGEIVVTAQVASNAPANVTNVASITIPPSDPTPSNNTSQLTTTIGDPPPTPNVTITKTGPATAGPGETIQYLISYRNTGGAAAAAVEIYDIFNQNTTTFVSASPSPTDFPNSSTMRWALGDLAPGASGTITLRFRVRDNLTFFAGTSNIVQITTLTPGDDPNDNMSTANTTFVFPNVTVAKSAPATVGSGGQIVYTLTYRNDGQFAAANVRVQDTLPPGTVFVSSAPPRSSGQFWNLGTLAPGQQGTISVVVNDVGPTGLGSPDGTTLTNRARIDTDTQESDYNDNDGQATTTVIGTNIAFAKAGPAQITVGDLITYTMRITNTSGVPARLVRAQDDELRQQRRDQGYAIVASEPPISGYAETFDYPVDDGAPFWDLGDMAPGASRAIVVTVRPPVSTASYSFTNIAYAGTRTWETSYADNAGQAATRIVVPDLAITKASDTPFPVLSGETVRYTLDWRNLAADAGARSAVISDTVPAQLGDVRWRCLSGCAAGGAGNALRLDLGDVPPGAAGQIEVLGTATTAQPREHFLNTAEISTATPEQSLANNRSSVEGEVWTPEVSLEKRATPSVLAGDTFTATLLYRNSGPAPAASLVLSDTLPAGVTFVSSAPAPSAQSGQTLTWDVGALAADETGSVELTLRAALALPDGAALRNRAAISVPPADRDPGNNQSEADTAVSALADLGVVKSVTPSAAVLAGSGLLTYTLTVTNHGPATATSVVVTDTPDTGLSLVSSQPEPLPGQPLRWELGSLAPGATASVELVVRVAANAPASVRNTARVGGASQDPNPANNTSSVDSPVTRAADVRITKVASANQVVAGSAVTYMLSYLNAGPSVAQGVVVSDDVPDALSDVTWSCVSGCSVSGRGNGLRINVGTLAVGAGGAIRVSGTTTAGTQPQIDVTNTAVITSVTPDPNPANNTSTSVTAAQTANLRIAKGGPARAAAGSLIRYTITVTNEGPLAAEAVQVQDALPPYLTLAAADPPPANGSTINPRWLLGTLAAGQSARISLDVRVAASAPGGSVLNTATTETTTPERRTDDNTASWSTLIETPGTTAVTLAYLRAERTGEGVAVTWQTLLEHNTAGFRVLRASSPSAQAASEVGRLESRGSGGGSYRLLDASPPDAPAWYWLVEVERDGSEHSYGPVTTTAPGARGVYLVFLPRVER
jgi:uncharacterized repeat protein (TIGR01451 family)